MVQKPSQVKQLSPIHVCKIGLKQVGRLTLEPESDLRSPLLQYTVSFSSVYDNTGYCLLDGENAGSEEESSLSYIDHHQRYRLIGRKV
jgi:hypothetical protein